MMEKFFSIKEVAEQQRVHANTVRAWIAKGWLKAHKVGGRVRIYESDLQAFLNRDGNDQR
jgi:excisionase family DNA binding protein